MAKKSKQVNDDFEPERQELRKLCEADFYTFAVTLSPYRYFGECHKEVMEWLANPFGNRNKLLLDPRDHQKSYTLALYVCWIITCDPTITIFYLSATALLAEAQLRQIKQILLSERYQLLWPEMINADEGKRDKWTVTEINVDHPLRQELCVRDSTVTCGGVGKVVTGLHPRVIIGDDVVVKENSRSEEGRHQLREYYSLLSSVESSSDGYNIFAGTFMHDKDLYHDLIEMKEDVRNEFGEIIDQRSVYDVIQRKVETNGKFLWPRAQAKDGKYYGFDYKTLETKKAKYLDKAEFYMQYYNDCKRGKGRAIARSDFVSYNPALLKYRDGYWHFKDRKLYTFGAMDFAFSVRKRSDNSVVGAIGIDWEENIYVLEMIVFKSEDPRVYLEHIISTENKWRLRAMSLEVVQAQNAIVKYIKQELTKEGSMLKIIEDRPNRHEGAKEDRIVAVLNPRYQDRKVLHPMNGDVRLLEEELAEPFSKTDDCKDCLTKAIMIAHAPRKPTRFESQGRRESNIIYNDFFGGYAGRIRNVR